MTAAWVIVRTPSGLTVMSRAYARAYDRTQAKFVSSHRTRPNAQAALARLKAQEGLTQ